MRYDVSDLACRLARNAEAVCRHYLSNGRREGRYWLVGDVRNTPGRSLFVRLVGGDTGKGAAGKWTDAAAGKHGDLLDIIRETCGLADFRDAAEEARRFLSLSYPKLGHDPLLHGRRHDPPAPAGSPDAARRLFRAAQPIAGTITAAYLRHRGITALHGTDSLRFHPRCYYRPDGNAPADSHPAMIAAVTDLAGNITGVHRTWLDPSGRDKAPVEAPRRAMGQLLGNAVRFGVARDVLAAGEGIETMLSLRRVLPVLPMAAALSAGHLAAILFPTTLRRLYIARDADPAGDGAVKRLIERTQAAGIEALVLSPQLGDFNEDLGKLGWPDLRGPAGSARAGGRRAFHGFMRRGRKGEVTAMEPASPVPAVPGGPLRCRKVPRRRAFPEGDLCRSRRLPAMAAGPLFPPPGWPAAMPGFASRTK